MRYVLTIIFLFVLSSVGPKHYTAANAQDFSYSQTQKAKKYEYRRYKKRYRRSYRRTRIVVRPRATISVAAPSFETPKASVLTFDWFEEKPLESYPWDRPVQIKTVAVYSPDAFNPMDKEAQEVVWKKRFFWSIWGTFVLVSLFFVYAVVGFVTTRTNGIRVDSKV